MDGNGAPRNLVTKTGTANQYAMYSAPSTISFSFTNGTTPGVFVFEFSNTQSKVGKSTKTLTNIGSLPTASLNGLFLGTRQDLTAFMSGAIAEFMIVSASLITSGQHNQIMDYLGSRYALTIGA